jgi:prophage maintenance system killer protein
MRQALEARRLLGYEKELASIINDYTQTWIILDRYDDGDLQVAKQIRKNVQELDYVKAKKTVEHFRDRLLAHDMVSGTFGRERGGQLAQILQKTADFKGNIEEKAAFLFYNLIKNRPFMDGNKRIASLLFVVYLIENNVLYDKQGNRKFNDNALIALALLVEESRNNDEAVLLNLIANLIGRR